MRIYSLPKKIAFTFNPNAALFSDVTFEVKANNERTSTSVKFYDITPNKEQTLVVDLAKVFNVDDMIIYPLTLSYIKFNINTAIEKTDHVIDIKSLQLIYDNDFVVEIDDITKANNLMVYPNPATDYIVVEGKEGDVVRVYDLEGKCITQCTMHNAQCTIDASSFTAGTYIIKSNTAFCKIIIK
jgi:hypothetical protein